MRQEASTLQMNLKRPAAHHSGMLVSDLGSNTDEVTSFIDAASRRPNRKDNRSEENELCTEDEFPTLEKSLRDKEKARMSNSVNDEEASGTVVTDE